MVENPHSDNGPAPLSPLEWNRLSLRDQKCAAESSIARVLVAIAQGAGIPTPREAFHLTYALEAVWTGMYRGAYDSACNALIPPSAAEADSIPPPPIGLTGGLEFLCVELARLSHAPPRNPAHRLC